MQSVSGLGITVAVLDSAIHLLNMKGVIRSIARDCTIRSFDIGSDGQIFDRKKVIQVFEQAIIPQKVPIVNLSWGTGYLIVCPPWTNDPDKGLEHVFKAATEQGTIIIASAGNDFNGDIGLAYPAISPYVIAASSQFFGVTQRHPDVILTPQISSSRASAFLSAVAALSYEAVNIIKTGGVLMKWDYDEVRKLLHSTSKEVQDPITELFFSQIDVLRFLNKLDATPAEDTEAQIRVFGTYTRPPRFIGSINWEDDEDHFLWTSTITGEIRLRAYDFNGNRHPVQLKQVRSGKLGNHSLTIPVKKSQVITIAITGPIGPYVIVSESRS